MNNILYIGLNGYAGAGKDTVAKMLRTILSRGWESFDECCTYYKTTYTDPTKSATFNSLQDEQSSPVICLAYADQLKFICSTMFGIPVERFYMNKSNAWICINTNFEYTEIKPDERLIYTADEYYMHISSYPRSDKPMWMNLREILVYIGTYVLQEDINRNIFVNIIRNKINYISRRNKNLKYVIITDNRFCHELDYIRENNGIMITIQRNGVQQLSNIAEHDLDAVNQYEYDYIIKNDTTYDDLLRQVWDIVHDNVEFSNTTYDLLTRENIDNYVRLCGHDDEGHDIYKLCNKTTIQTLYHNDGKITMLSPVGGPTICVGKELELVDYTHTLIVHDIQMDETGNGFRLYC